MSIGTLHHSHPDVVRRLRRTQGQLSSVIEMIEKQRSCLAITQQMHAIERALAHAKETLIRDHLDHCLEEALEAGGSRRKAAMVEFKEITRYL
jgi:DNA-binding FrmR family transcriptional regulator